jgi:hypothetical protein
VIRPRAAALSVAAWVLGAATSIGVGLLALALVGEDLRGDASRPLTADAAAVVADPTPSAHPPATTTTAASPTSPGAAATVAGALGDDRRLTSAGGDVVARCTTAGAYLVYWTPAQGFRTDDVQRGPAPVSTLTFEATSAEIKLKITCVGGTPQLEVATDGHGDD